MSHRRRAQPLEPEEVIQEDWVRNKAVLHAASTNSCYVQYQVWGNHRGGGGAPLKDHSGHTITNLQPVINGEGKTYRTTFQDSQHLTPLSSLLVQQLM